MSTLPPHRFIDRLAAELVRLGTALLALLLLGSWAGLWAGVPITQGHLWLAIGATAVLALARRGTGTATAPIFALALCLAWLGAGLMFGRAVFDASWDGMVYHQLAIAPLRDGWNPTVEPHLLDWLHRASGLPAEVIDSISDEMIDGDAIWTSHYPKGGWVIAATFAAATGSLGASKGLQFFMPLLALAAMFRGFRSLGLTPTAAALFGLAAVASPVVIVQLSTNYVDGLLACATALGVGAALAWLTERRGTDLFVLLAAFVLATNLKFTGLVYAGLMVFAVVGLAATRGWRPRRAEWGGVAAGLLALVLASAQTYGHNLLVHGHPMYPMNKTDVMHNQSNDAFLNLNRFDKLARSLFQVPNNRKTGVPSLEFVRPKLAHYATLVQSADTRFAAFGSLFGWSLLPALACLSAGLTGVLRGGRRQPALLLVIGWAALSVMLNPEMWWLRYAPQLWLLPVLAAALAWLAGWRRLAWFSVVLALASSAMTAAFWANRTLADERRMSALWRYSVAAGRLTVLDIGPRSPGLLALAEHAHEHGLTLQKRPVEHCTLMRLGALDVCAGP